MIPDLAALKDTHKGDIAAVLGGGSSLPEDIWKIPVEARLIGVNRHAIILPLDYIVFLDDLALCRAVANHPAWKITNARYDDVPRMIWGSCMPNYGISGPAAVWVADWLGFDEILVAGMDAYGGKRKYWHSNPGEDYVPRPMTPRPWERCFDDVQHPERIKFLSGNTGDLKMWGSYEN